MKLSEMGELVAKQNTHGISLERFKNFKKIGVLNEFDIEKSDIEDNLVCYKLTIDNKDIFYFVGIEFGNNIQIKRTWMNQEYRNQGIATKFYKKLYLTYNFSLISDNELSPESVSIWQKLFELYSNRIFLTDTNLKHFQELKSFDDFFKNANFLLILKQPESSVINISDNPVKVETLNVGVPQNLLSRILQEYELGGSQSD